MVCSAPIQGAAAERSLMGTGAGGTSDVAITAEHRLIYGLSGGVLKLLAFIVNGKAKQFTLQCIHFWCKWRKHSKDNIFIVFWKKKKKEYFMTYLSFGNEFSVPVSLGDQSSILWGWALVFLRIISKGKNPRSLKLQQWWLCLWLGSKACSVSMQ